MALGQPLFTGRGAPSAPLTYAQEYLPIREIVDGMIVTQDGRYLKVLEVIPTNFSMRTPADQEGIIFQYMKFLKIGPKKMQLKVLSRPANTEAFVNKVYEKMQTEKNETVIAFGKNYANYITTTGTATAISRRFYLIYEYEPTTRKEKANATPASIAKEMDRVADNIKAYFAQCGNTVLRPQNETKELASFLYEFYNPRTCFRESFTSRRRRIVRDVRTVYGLEEEDPLPFIDPAGLFAPRGLSFAEKGATIMDGIYSTHLYLDGDRIPALLNVGWMNALIGLGIGVDIDVFTERLPADVVSRQIGQKYKFAQLGAAGKEEHQGDYKDVTERLTGARQLKKLLDAGEDPYDVSFLLTISAGTREELTDIRREILTFLESQNLPARSCTLTEEEAFRSTSPYLALSPKIKKRAARTMTTSGVAACYPFTAFELCDNGGVLLGTNQENGSLVAIDVFDTAKYVNANMCLLGTSGAGKTYLLQLLLLRMRTLGAQVFCISPDKQDEFVRSCRAIGGQYVDLSPSSKDRINILDIRPRKAGEDEGDGDSSWRDSKVVRLLTFFSLLITNPVLSDDEEQLLENAIIRAYEKKGIGKENSTVFKEENHPEKGVKEMPILEDVYRELQGEREERIRTILSKFVYGGAKSFNGQTNVDLDNKFIVFGLEHIGERLEAPGMYAALDIVFEKSKEDRTKPKVIAIDEGWQLVNGENLKSAAYVQRIFKTIRGLGGSAIFATQQVTDLYAIKGGKFGDAIISCSESIILLKMKIKQAEKVADILDLSPRELQEITNYSKGHALLCAGPSHLPIQIKASKMEHDLITTDAKELAALQEKEERRADHEDA